MFERCIFALRVIKISVAKRAKQEEKKKKEKENSFHRNTTTKNNTSTSYIPGHLNNPL